MNWVIETPYAAWLFYGSGPEAEHERRSAAIRESCFARKRPASRRELKKDAADQPKGPRMSDCERAFMRML